MKTDLDATEYSLQILRAAYQYIYTKGEPDAMKNAETIEKASDTVRQVSEI